MERTTFVTSKAGLTKEVVSQRGTAVTVTTRLCFSSAVLCVCVHVYV